MFGATVDNADLAAPYVRNAAKARWRGFHLCLTTIAALKTHIELAVEDAKPRRRERV